MYDAIIVGARCAGSPLAMLLARAGQRVLLVDRDSFPSDTMSTSYMQMDAILRMRRWGLYDRLVDAGTPAYAFLNVAIGPMELQTAMEPVQTHAPRRFVLDQILLDGAREAGAEVRERCSVQEVLKDGDGRVTGVRLQVDGSQSVVEESQVLVGADGRNSVVARAVEPPQSHYHEGLTSGYYGIYSGFSSEDAAFYFRSNHLIFCFPTNNNAAFVGFEGPASNFENVRSDPEGHLMRLTSEHAPALHKRLEAGERTEKLMGFGARPSFYRKPYGPGWALVGDAGFLKDPLLGDGINDAFRDAELLAGALDAGLSGREPLEDALAKYESAREAASLPRYELTHDFCEALPIGFSRELIGRFAGSTAERSAAAAALLAV